jgi:hypothetical protein
MNLYKSHITNEKKVILAGKFDGDLTKENLSLLNSQGYCLLGRNAYSKGYYDIYVIDIEFKYINYVNQQIRDEKLNTILNYINHDLV